MRQGQGSIGQHDVFARSPRARLVILGVPTLRLKPPGNSKEDWRSLRGKRSFEPSQDAVFPTMVPAAIAEPPARQRACCVRYCARWPRAPGGGSHRLVAQASAQRGCGPRVSGPLGHTGWRSCATAEVAAISQRTHSNRPWLEHEMPPPDMQLGEVFVFVGRPAQCQKLAMRASAARMAASASFRRAFSSHTCRAGKRCTPRRPWANLRPQWSQLQPPGAGRG